MSPLIDASGETVFYPMSVCFLAAKVTKTPVRSAKAEEASEAEETAKAEEAPGAEETAKAKKH